MNLEKSDEKAMKNAVKFMHEYWATYSRQHGYEKYAMRTFLEDALYSIGISIDAEKYQNARGYGLFKKDLLDFLNGLLIDKPNSR